MQLQSVWESRISLTFLGKASLRNVYLYTLIYFWRYMYIVILQSPWWNSLLCGLVLVLVRVSIIARTALQVEKRSLFPDHVKRPTAAQRVCGAGGCFISMKFLELFWFYVITWFHLNLMYMDLVFLHEIWLAECSRTGDMRCLTKSIQNVNRECLIQVK